MTPKQRALKHTLGLIFTGLAGGAITVLALTFFTIPQIGIALCVVIITYLLRFVYLGELEKQESLDRLNNPKG